MDQTNEVFKYKLENGKEITLSEDDLYEIYLLAARKEILARLNTLKGVWSRALIDEVAKWAVERMEHDAGIGMVWEPFIDSAISFIKDDIDILIDQYKAEHNTKGVAALEEFERMEVWNIRFIDEV